MAALEDTTSRKGTWIVKGNRAGRYGVIVAHFVVSPTSQAVPVSARLFNRRKESAVVRKGAQIARMEQLVGTLSPRHPQKHPPGQGIVVGNGLQGCQSCHALLLRKKNCIMCFRSIQ